MNEQTTKLIESLADKLGTTAEYLCAVLIRQAHITAIICLVQLIISVAILYGLYKLIRLCIENVDEDAGYAVGMVISGAAMLLLSLVVFFGIIPEMITSFFSPEYWALHEILKSI